MLRSVRNVGNAIAVVVRFEGLSVDGVEGRSAKLILESVAGILKDRKGFLIKNPVK